MKHSRWILAGLAIALPSIAGAVALPAWRGAFLSAGVAGAGAVVAVRMIATYVSGARRGPSAFEVALRRSTIRTSRPADLEALERVLGWRTYAGEEFDHRVRPVLLRIARARILERHGIDPTVAPDAAGALVDPHLRAVFQSEPTPRPVTTADLERMVAAIEEAG